MVKIRILAILAASYTAGVAWSVYGPTGGVPLPLSGLCALAAAFFVLLCRKKTKTVRRVLLIVLGVSLGLSWTAEYKSLFVKPAEELEDRTVRMTAQVLQWPVENRRGWTVPVRTLTESGAGVDAVLYVDEQGAQLRPGDRIESVVHCTPADRSRSGDEITYFTAKGIFLRGIAYGELRVDRPEKPPLRAVPALLSRKLEEHIYDAFGEETGAQVLAIVLGNRKNLTKPFTSSLQRAGLSHTAAVSGMHLSFLAAFLTSVLGKHRRRTALLVMPLVLVFMFAAGCTPSVVRATVMLLMLLTAPLLGRERDEATSLGTALLVLLVQNPLAITHVGLQLSFAAVAGIFLTAETVDQWLRERLHMAGRRRGRLKKLLMLLPDYAVSVVSTTMGAMIFTMPLTALHFSSISLVAPLANLMTLWAVAGVFCGGLAVGVLGFASPALAKLLAEPVSVLAGYMNWAVRGLSELPFAAITMESFYYKLWAVLMAVGILTAVVSRRRKRYCLPGSLAVITLCIAMLFTHGEFKSGRMTVTAFDVGQGQCVLLRQGDFLTLVDCGGDSFDSAGDIAADHIQNTGRNRLDLLILSHFHADHANGVPQLLERLEVGAAAIPEGEEELPLRDEILAMLEEQDIPCFYIRGDTKIHLGNENYLDIFPPLGRENINERGLTVLASSGENRALFTGDMDAETEKLLLEHTQLPKVEVMMAGHHGSKQSNSEELLRTVSPEIVLVSAGQGNRFGHPHKETLDRMKNIGVYRTDLCGTIKVELNETPST